MGDKPNEMESRSIRKDKKSKKNKNITNDIDVGVPKEKSHKHKEKKMKSKSIEDVDQDRRDNSELGNADYLQKKDKKKKRKRDSSDPDQAKEDEPGHNDVTDQKSRQKSHEDDQHDKGNIGNGGDLQKKDKKKSKRGSSDAAQIKENEGPDLEKKKSGKKKKKKTETNGIMAEESNIEDNPVIKRKKVKGSKEKEKSTESVENDTEKPKSKRKLKKVSFSSNVEVFPPSDTESEKKTPKKTDGLVRGKRYTPEEDAILVEAVNNYITVHNLGENGLHMILNCQGHKGLRKCWEEISTRLPHRPKKSIYFRAHSLLEKGGEWTAEDTESLKELHEKYGNNWKLIGIELGKHRLRAKDMWRRHKFTNANRGRWSQEEYQNLYDLVNLDLQLKVYKKKKSQYGMLRDDIPWCAISDKLQTRSDALCCMKWYNQLTSSLVKENQWCDADDYRMIGELYKLDATCAEDVDWDHVLEHRPGEICRKRWDQMVKHIGHQGSKPFAEQVDILAQRYCPDLAEIREHWDNKVPVD